MLGQPPMTLCMMYQPPWFYGCMDMVSCIHRRTYRNNYLSTLRCLYLVKRAQFWALYLSKDIYTVTDKKYKYFSALQHPAGAANAL